jgi:hypothetical protein
MPLSGEFETQNESHYANDIDPLTPELNAPRKAACRDFFTGDFNF